MMTRHRRKSFLRRLSVPLVAAGLMAYFGYHAFTGAFGIWAMDRLEVDAARLTADLDTLKAEHAALERRVAMMRPPRLDADMIDLEARHSLNLMRADEVVILDATRRAAQD
jgi:cell division protein FtsB